MNLSDKYILKEDKFNIDLYEIKDSEIKENGVPTGEFVKKEKLVGHFPPSRRDVIYRKLINLEISALEKQSLENILDTVEKTSEQVVDWFKEQEGK